MPELMTSCDVGVTSRGRTGYELALLGIPTIAMAQNKREEKHGFVCNENGFTYIGLNPADEIIEARHQLTLKAATTLGLPLSNIHSLEYPDGGIDIAHTETEKLKILLEELSPKSLFLPHNGEGWSDHINVMGIVKKLMKCHVVNIYEYCVWMWLFIIRSS
jgi:LmbE family N-acetylglucosaminyl deacetylase